MFDRDETFIGVINDILNCKHTEELNGEIYLEMTTLHNISKGQRIVYRDSYKEWHEFIVKGVEEDRDDSLIRKIYAEHSIYETIGDYVDDKRPRNVTANIALADALLTTRWTVGLVDDLGIKSTNFYHISAMEAIQKVADVWEGELRFRIEVSGSKIVNRYVDLLDRRGEDSQIVY